MASGLQLAQALPQNIVLLSHIISLSNDMMSKMETGSFSVHAGISGPDCVDLTSL